MTQPITFPAPKFMGRGYDANAVDQWIEENYPPAVESDTASANTWPVDVENPEGEDTYAPSDDERVVSLMAQNESLEVSRVALRKEATAAREERDQAIAARDQALAERDQALEEADRVRDELKALEAEYRSAIEENEQVQATATEQAENVAELEELDAQDDAAVNVEVQSLRIALREAEESLAGADEELRELRAALEEAQSRQSEWTTPAPEPVIQVDPVMRSVEIITQAEKVASEHIAESQRKRDQLEAEYESRKAQLTAEVEEHRAHLVDSIADLEAREDRMFGKLAEFVQDAKAFLNNSEEQLDARREAMPQDRLTVRQ